MYGVFNAVTPCGGRRARAATAFKWDHLVGKRRYA
jgi:hypothetical protein